MNTEIALLMMVKDEEKHVAKTLNSVRKFVKTVVVLDTGSTDNTLGEISEWCREHQKFLHAKVEPFVDFATSRNSLLSFADSITTEKWFLLMDASDEFNGPIHILKEALNQAVETQSDGVFLSQIWMFELGHIYYKNCRIVRARSGWHYIGVVHEYITKDSPRYYTCPSKVHLFQNRLLDGGKSKERFRRDYVLLKESVVKDPKNARSVYYLAKTCLWLNYRDQAAKYFLQRTQMGDFFEEVYHSYMELGQLALAKKQNRNAIEYFLRAFDTDERVEPLIELASIYRSLFEWHTAFIYIERALSLELPERLLVVDAGKYSYTRWHLMGIVAYYSRDKEIGMRACRVAIEKSPNDVERKQNEDNLACYSKVNY